MSSNSPPEYKKAYAYGRSSVQSMDNNTGMFNNMSLDTQIELCTKYCMELGIDSITVVREYGSARNIDKLPKLLELVDKMENNTLLVIADSTRFLRNTQQALNILRDLQTRNIVVHFVGDNLSYGKHVSHNERHHFRVALSLAEMESDRTSYRVKRSYAYRKAHGGAIGSPPYGYTHETNENGMRIKCINKDEKVMCDVIGVMREQGQSCQEIANVLNQNNSTFRGKPWTAQSVNVVSKIKFNKTESKRKATDNIDERPAKRPRLDRAVKKVRFAPY
jgi:DNA invertase Pin-like site-specific DNA recombinase